MTTTTDPPPATAAEQVPPPQPCSRLHVVDAAPVIEPTRKSSQIPHWVFLSISLLVVVLAVTMRAPGEERVYLPFVSEPVPGTCVSRELGGVECPGCGLTRSFICLGHGQVGRAWHFNPAGILFFAVVVFQVPYRAVQLWRIRRGRDELRPVLTTWWLYGLALALILQWAVRRILELVA